MSLYLGSKQINRVDVMKRVTLDNVSLESKTVSPSQQTQTYTPSTDYDGFSQITVNGAPLQQVTTTPEEYIQTITPSSGYYGMSKVVITSMELGTKTITENGVYRAANEALDGYKVVTVNIPDKGIQPIIANDGSIVPTGTYATDVYYNTEYGVKIGYMANGDVMISMKNGTTTSYENIYFYAASLPSGVTLDAPSTFGTGNVVNMTFVGIISGLTGSANIAIDMSTRNGTTDYVRCDLTITYV